MRLVIAQRMPNSPVHSGRLPCLRGIWCFTTQATIVAARRDAAAQEPTISAITPGRPSGEPSSSESPCGAAVGGGRGNGSGSGTGRDVLFCSDAPKFVVVVVVENVVVGNSKSAESAESLPSSETAWTMSATMSVTNAANAAAAAAMRSPRRTHVLACHTCRAHSAASNSSLKASRRPRLTARSHNICMRNWKISWFKRL
mmetsp:Transcript_58158/g.168868  ORF Transcript_58158/g.168868 Transcript_58158/m.168868 type:complete len:200 (+) Transcript_58158:212-811(+)